MTQTPITANFHQALDIHLHFTSQISLDGDILCDIVAEGRDFLLSEIPDLRVGTNPGGKKRLASCGSAYTVDVRQTDFRPFISR
jgi:hypothetical protein